jgi:hypothetical protein
MPPTTQLYDPERDGEAVFELGQATLGPEWPLTPALFQQVIGSMDIARSHGHFVALEANTTVGFVATQTHLGSGTGAISEHRSGIFG